jgi:Rrf2 family protein
MNLKGEDSAMKLTSQSEYALLALIYLARKNSTEFVTIREIANKQNIPPKFLEQIFTALKRAHFLHSLKGQTGGYKLAKPAKDISMAEIIRLFDGALAPVESVSKYFYEASPIEKEKKVIKVLRDVRDYISQKMESTSIADMC